MGPWLLPLGIAGSIPRCDLWQLIKHCHKYDPNYTWWSTHRLPLPGKTRQVDTRQRRNPQDPEANGWDGWSFPLVGSPQIHLTCHLFIPILLSDEWILYIHPNSDATSFYSCPSSSCASYPKMKCGQHKNKPSSNQSCGDCLCIIPTRGLPTNFRNCY